MQNGLIAAGDKTLVLEDVQIRFETEAERRERLEVKPDEDGPPIVTKQMLLTFHKDVMASYGRNLE